MPKIRTQGAAARAAALLFAGCGGSSDGASGGGEGVSAGATMAECQAAFEDVSEITLEAQTQPQRRM